ERLFQGYLRRFVTERVVYASLLRPMSELRIMEILTRYPQYFACATSCNANWKILGDASAAGGEEMQRRSGNGAAARTEILPYVGGAGYLRPRPWCGACPKCAFCFALMAAFVPRETVLAAFGRDLFSDEGLAPLYRQLWGIDGFKPFECVGTPEETRAAFL